MLIYILQKTTSKTSKPIILVSSHCDGESDPNKRKVSTQEGLALARELGQGYVAHVETSINDTSKLKNVNEVP